MNLGVRYDLQFLKTIATDTNNVSPRAGFAWSPFASRRTVVRGSFRALLRPRAAARAGERASLERQYHGYQRNSSQISVSLSPTQTGAPVFPEHPRQPTVPAGVLVNFTTMDRHMQNAYSEQGSLEIEQQIGRAQHAERRLSASARTASDRFGQSERADLRRRRATTTDAARTRTYANNSQYSPLADSHYDGLHVSFVQRPVRWGNYRISYTWSKALDNVGEFFFSSPIDNFNIWQDYGRSRRRPAASRGVRRHDPFLDGAAQTPGSGISHGFQLSGMLQYYSALPLNITSGRHHHSGHRRPAHW